MISDGNGTCRWVGWRVELGVRPGMLAPLQELTREMVEAARGEPGTLDYVRFFGSAGAPVLHLWERYAHALAACEHLDMFADRFERRFLHMVTRHQCVVYGAWDEALRRKLRPLAPTYLSIAMGFVGEVDL